MKKIIMLLVVCAIAIFAIVSVGRGNFKSYYSGDAVLFRGDLIIATTDTGSLEIFKLNDALLERSTKFKAPNSVLDKTKDFSSVKLNVEGDRLFAYATSAYTLYKYDVSDPSSPVLFAKQRNTYFEWYKRVDRFGPYMATVSDSGVKLWKIDTNTLDIIDFFKVENDQSSAVRFDASGRYIISVNTDNLVRIFDTKTRTIISTFSINSRDNKNLRKPYFDPAAQELYVFDDYYLKRFDLNGDLLLSYPNSSTNGYAVEPSGSNDFVYAVNGDSIMKLAKKDLKTGIKISAFKATANGYAMGLKYVNTDSGDNLIVFNGGGIAVFNSSLKKIASIQASEVADQPEAKENLALSFDHNVATPGANVTLSGTGYIPGEYLNIDFGGETSYAVADTRGRFQQTLTVPEVAAKAIDAKVDGVTSGLTYSTNFKIVK